MGRDDVWWERRRGLSTQSSERSVRAKGLGEKLMFGQFDMCAATYYVLNITRLQRAVGSRAAEGKPDDAAFVFWVGHMKTIVYVDGFNLYFRLLKGRPEAKWVNLVALVRKTLPKNDIIKVRYFTARVSGRLDPDAPRRQQLYLDALQSIPEIEIHYGSFLEKPKYAGLVKPGLRSSNDNQIPFRPWPDVAFVWKTEEKGSDVNIATYLLLDGFQNLYEAAVVLSNDSDLAEPIRLANSVLKKPVGILSPVDKPTRGLASSARFIRHVVLADARACQFPSPMELPDGTSIQKPASWA